MAKMADFNLLNYPKLISRKIWMTENSWNFHTGIMFHVKSVKIFTSIHSKITKHGENIHSRTLQFMKMVKCEITFKLYSHKFWSQPITSRGANIFTKKGFSNSQKWQTLSCSRFGSLWAIFLTYALITMPFYIWLRLKF